MEKHAKQLIQWFKEQLEQTGAKGFIVGLSGGIDSAVVSYLIKEAAPNDSLAVIMPCHSDLSDIADAMEVIRASNIDYTLVDLSDEHKTLLAKINQSAKQNDEETTRIVDANLRARLRMSTLYALAAHHNYLVVGTDNKAEWHMGYFTKYGDGGVDLAPIIHYTKSEIYELAAYFNMPERLMKKAPSAGLWEGQTDEQEMGVTYRAIDAYLRGEPIKPEEQKVIENTHRRTEHKRNLPVSPPDFH